MKKGILASVLILLVGLSPALAQTKQKQALKFNFCNAISDTVMYSELEKCAKLTCANTQLDVKSYTLGMIINGKNADFKITGSELSKAAMDGLKMSESSEGKKVRTIIVKDIISSKGALNSHDEGFVFYLK